MTNRRKSRIVQAALLCASASVLAACQTTSPYVARQAEDARQQPARPAQPYDSEGNPVAAPSGQVSSQPLPPAPVQPAYTPPPPPPPPVYQPPAYQPPVYQPPAPRPVATPAQYRTVTTGKVVDAEGPSVSYTVKSGDALDAIAREMGVTRKVLADLNDLKTPYKIRPGQKLKGPRAKAKAYVVGSGDTLSAIGRRFGVSAQAIADANDMERSDSIRPGQKLILPKGFKDAGPQRILVAAAVTPPPVYSPPPTVYTPPPAPVPAPTPAPTPPPTTSYPRPTTPVSPPPTGPVSAQPVTPAPRPAPPAARPAAPAVTSTLSEAQIRATGRGKFVWPVRGRVITPFGPSGTAQANNGINISASSGTSVRAAAAGSVIYAGSLPDFGNIVIVQHESGFITSYAHLSRVLVKITDQVRQNQEIGEVGQTGGVLEPQLYFEIRLPPSATSAAKPFDPMILLPGG